MNDPYEVLGVNKNADTATIKEAYRTLARKHHPDRGGDVNKFKQATAAYSILSDKQKDINTIIHSPKVDLKAYMDKL